MELSFPGHQSTIGSTASIGKMPGQISLRDSSIDVPNHHYEPNEHEQEMLR